MENDNIQNNSQESLEDWKKRIQNEKDRLLANLRESLEGWREELELIEKLFSGKKIRRNKKNSNSAFAEFKEPDEAIDYLLESTLDVLYEVSLSGYIQNITIVLGTGGPHIQLNLHSSELEGFWGDEKAHLWADTPKTIEALWEDLEGKFDAKFRIEI